MGGALAFATNGYCQRAMQANGHHTEMPKSIEYLYTSIPYLVSLLYSLQMLITYMSAYGLILKLNFALFRSIGRMALIEIVLITPIALDAMAGREEMTFIYLVSHLICFLFIHGVNKALNYIAT